MKKTLCKNSSTPEPFPRLSLGQTTLTKRRQESKLRHSTGLDISPWYPLTGADTRALPLVCHNSPTQIDRRRPSEKHVNLSDRSLPCSRHSALAFPQGMATMLRAGDDANDDRIHTPNHLHVPDDLEVPGGSPVPDNSHYQTHCHGPELGTYVNSGLGMNHSLGHVHHREESKNHLHIRVPGNIQVPGRRPVPDHSHKHTHCHGLEIGTYVNSGLGMNHSLGHFHHSEEGKRHVPIRVPANKDVPGVSPVPDNSHYQTHCYGPELGTYVNSGLGVNHSLARLHHREEGKHSSSHSVWSSGGGGSRLHTGGRSPRPRHVSFDRHTHCPRHVKIRIGPPRTPTVSPTGDLGVPVHLGDLGPRGERPSPPQSVREDREQGPSINKRIFKTEDEQNIRNGQAKINLTYPGLTQEVLTSGLYSDSEQTEDRVFDWLEECDGKVTPASLPPHLPEIDRQRRCKPSNG